MLKCLFILGYFHSESEITLSFKLLCKNLAAVFEPYLKVFVSVLFFSDALDPDIVAAASAAAATLPNQSQAESELLKQLRQRKALTEAQKKGDINNLGYISCVQDKH